MNDIKKASERGKFIDAGLRKDNEKAANEALKRLIIDRKYAAFPPHALPVNPLKKYSLKRGANKEESKICDFLNLSGHWCERTKTQGRYIDRRRVITDCLGRTKIIGRAKWVHGTSTNGSSDLKAIIHGRFIALEVKYGKDRQSEAQKAYRRRIEQCNGIYVIAHDFPEFYKWYLNFIKRLERA